MKSLFRKTTLGTLLLLVGCISGHGQNTDTLRVMVYNLTNYGNNITNQCTTQNNGLTLKNPDFKTILKYAMPDVLGVCEMNTNPSIATNFLNNVLNTDGVTYYKRSNPQAEPSGTLTSILFFNSEKLTLAKQSFASTQYRLTHHFRLYLNTENLSLGDTLWLNVLVCHLKAGTTTADVTDRGNMATTIRNYLNTLPKNENCLIMGDFNVYRSSEVAFQTLTAAGTRPAYQFLDPVNRVGSWTSNSSFADVHTQCPSTNYNTSCYSGGGLDDRFDFILMNRHALYDSAGIRYIIGTYKALGNDGQHYNRAIIDNPVNTSVPSTVLNAIYRASDHLPVQADLRISGRFITGFAKQKTRQEFSLQRTESGFHVQGLEENEALDLEIFEPSGRRIWHGNARVWEGEIKISAALPSSSLLFIRGLSRSGKTGFTRFIR